MSYDSSKHPDKVEAAIFVVMVFLLCFFVPANIGLALLLSIISGLLVWVFVSSKPYVNPMRDEANAYAWVMFLFTIALCALFYIIFSPIFAALKALAVSLGIACGVGTTCANIFAVHEQWPLLLIGGLLLWVIVLAIRKEPTSGYY